jgi:hypothetical protein
VASEITVADEGFSRLAIVKINIGAKSRSNWLEAPSTSKLVSLFLEQSGSELNPDPPVQVRLEGRVIPESEVKSIVKLLVVFTELALVSILIVYELVAEIVSSYMVTVPLKARFKSRQAIRRIFLRCGTNVVVKNSINFL